MWTALQNMLIYQRPILILVIVSNILGTIYGYIWYAPQLLRSPWYFWPFIPDSPTATLFLVISLVLLLLNKKNAIIDTLAFITLLKYGVWAVMMNFLLFIEDNTIYIMGVMLIISHGIMAIQALIFLPQFKFTLMSLAVAIIWIFHNDVVDYVFHQYPVYGGLGHYESQIGYLAFWLSVLPILFVIYQLSKGKKIDQV
ncbi:DUF1405 domain-containing protein [Staphylococcus intermedius]|nr:DUF1405 domain-containing protein [Staphylococcus intermedius]PCF65722.1 hypothetical protein B5C04_02265 [Staphylococcus intermedius]PCF81402.1 hypothetical protein B4W74_02280 [Staphylococcus intermedius]PCF82683.1 hypothetical protein B4W70_02265 [Staphylococcus intermedius]PCF88639.1 hypothetical protein B4W75_05310 [Staphylococcus intermedius]PCF89246.1 hypothetical protein B4W76_01305 [Staphylococcus intermedius]